MTHNIPLVKDTITNSEIDRLIAWLGTYPRLTKGEQTLRFEKLWSEWNGTRHSTYVNSGSTANLAAFYALMLSGRMKNKKVILPAVSWATTVAPAIQLGLEPVLCDCNLSNLGLDIDHLKKLVVEHSPALIVTVNVLGFANDYNEILQICSDNNILLMEDSCESIGTVYSGRKTGNFGDISTFSYYFGHHMSTIEGGMVCTNDEELANLVVSIRSHGWDRDLSKTEQSKYRLKYGVDDFRAIYTFYHPGFNIRSTDLQAYLGCMQLEKIDDIVEKRQRNFESYTSLLPSNWGLNVSDHDRVSNFAYPVLAQNVSEISKQLATKGVESRPLICGSISRQPFWYERFGNTSLKNADMIHDFGMYLPNNPDMTQEEISHVCSIVGKTMIPVENRGV
jgi:CDP-6-deoxy-D-xylo-4-hexulose-3-dehydrase